jgi:hypothetical protein
VRVCGGTRLQGWCDATDHRAWSPATEPPAPPYPTPRSPADSIPSQALATAAVHPVTLDVLLEVSVAVPIGTTTIAAEDPLQLQLVAGWPARIVATGLDKEHQRADAVVSGEFLQAMQAMLVDKAGNIVSDVRCLQGGLCGGGGGSGLRAAGLQWLSAGFACPEPHTSPPRPFTRSVPLPPFPAPPAL